MIEELVIELPDGLTVDGLYRAAAIKSGWTPETTQLGAEQEHVAADATAARAFVDDLRVSGGELIPPARQEQDGSFIITYRPAETVANPVDILAAGQAAIEERFREEAIDAIEAVEAATPIPMPTEPMTATQLETYIQEKRQEARGEAEKMVRGKGRLRRPL